MDGQQYSAAPPQFSYDAPPNGQQAVYPPPAVLPDTEAPWYQPEQQQQQQQQQPPNQFYAPMPPSDPMLPPLPAPEPGPSQAEAAYSQLMQEFGVKPEPAEVKMQFPGPPPVDQHTFHFPAPPEFKQEEVKPEPRARRNRFGPPMISDTPAPAPAPAPAAESASAPEPEEEGKKKKRRSRWETSTESAVGHLLPTFPRELMLPGGIKVAAPPSALSHLAVHAMHVLLCGRGCARCWSAARTVTVEPTRRRA
jgi:hypothetical protein